MTKLKIFNTFFKKWFHKSFLFSPYSGYTNMVLTSAFLSTCWIESALIVMRQAPAELEEDATPELIEGG